MAEAVTLLKYPKEYQQYIDRAPLTHEEMHARSTSNDQTTINSWRDQWIAQYRRNKEFFGSFADYSLGKLFEKHLHKPAILVGSGPHLKQNAHLLTDKRGMVILSCLHNFHYLEDLGVDVDYYVSLDAGEVVLEEVSEGGNPETDYWAKTKGKTLIAYACSHPELFEKWQGDIYVYNCPVPDQVLGDACEKIEKFNTHVSTGGNVLGACLYIAKAYLGCSTTIFVGASFCFDPESAQFHPWQSKYDAKQGHVLRMPDIFGYKVKTWPSYANFCNWFNYVSERCPGEYINCTEGGMLGAYESGNIRSIKQMNLEDALARFSLTRHIRDQAENPQTSNVKILF